jgi:arylsulfatase
MPLKITAENRTPPVHRAVGLLFALALASACAEKPASVVLISVDTLRADRLGIYGYDRDTSPHIDAFFGEGTVFENATSSAPCTIPAVRQFLEGAFVREPNRPNLTELLRARGYQTAAIVSQNQFYWRSEDYTRGFDHFDVQPREAVDVFQMSTRTAPEAVDRALAWLKARAEHDPFFLWLHLFDPHDPYSAPPEFLRPGDGSDPNRSGDPRSVVMAVGDANPRGTVRNMPRDRFDDAAWANYSARYDAEIRFVDAELARLFAHLETTNLDSETVVLLLSDHGEWLGEEQHWNHCLTVLQTEVRVPFLLRVRGGRFHDTKRTTDPVSTLDALPTLAGLVGASLPAGSFDGVDLRPPRSDRVVASLWAGQVAVRERDWKLIFERGTPTRLYHVTRDPAERWNQIFDRPDISADLAVRAEPYVALREAIDAEKIERALRRMGYIR